MLSASLRKIAPLWVILKHPAPAGVVSNAPSVINGLASNPSRKSKTNSAPNLASPKPAPAPTKPAESAKLAIIIIQLAAVARATNGKMEAVNDLVKFSKNFTKT